MEKIGKLSKARKKIQKIYLYDNMLEGLFKACIITLSWFVGVSGLYRCIINTDMSSKHSFTAGVFIFSLAIIMEYVLGLNNSENDWRKKLFLISIIGISVVIFLSASDEMLNSTYREQCLYAYYIGTIILQFIIWINICLHIIFGNNKEPIENSLN